MQYVNIESKENEQIKKIVRLGHFANARQESGCAIIYGEHLVEEALKYEFLESVVIHVHALNKYKSILNKIDLINEQQTPNMQVVVYLTTSAILNKINVLLNNPTDIVGVVRIKPSKDKNFNNNSDYLLLESLQNPGNLGAIFRAAAASGVKNICLSKNCVDHFNPKVLRSSQGIQFALNIYSDVDMFEFIRQYSGLVIATTPTAQPSIYDLDLRLPTAFIFGNEGGGLSKELLNAVKVRAKIPMAQGVESINIAMATSICLFEMTRQRLC